MKCALCGNGTSFEVVSRADSKSSAKLLVSMCAICGLVQQDPIPTADELKVYYSHNYRNDYKNTYTPKPKHIYRAGSVALRRISFLKENRILDGNLLDVGAGGGEFVYLSKVYGFNSEGIEPNIGYSEFANREYGCNVRTSELEAVDKKFDVITMFHVLEHLPSPLAAFKKLHSLLNKKGKLCVEVPWIEAADASPHNIYFNAHIFYFSADTLISCASQFFNVSKVDTTSNLRIIFEAKEEPSMIALPDAESVNRLRNRLKKKGWLEYLFAGKGFTKPINKILRTLDEANVTGLAPKLILDRLAHK